MKQTFITLILCFVLASTAIAQAQKSRAKQTKATAKQIKIDMQAVSANLLANLIKSSIKNKIAITHLVNSIRRLKTQVGSLNVQLAALRFKRMPACYLESHHASKRWGSCKVGYGFQGGLGEPRSTIHIATPRHNTWHTSRHVWLCCKGVPQ